MKQPHYELNIVDNVGGQMYVVNPSDRIKIAAAATTDAFFEAPYLNGNVIVHKPYYDAAINGRFNLTDHPSINQQLRCLVSMVTYSTSSPNRSNNIDNESL